MEQLNSYSIQVIARDSQGWIWYRTVADTQHVAQIESRQTTPDGVMLVLRRPIQNVTVLIKGGPIERLGSFEEGENIVRVAFSTNTRRSRGEER